MDSPIKRGKGDANEPLELVSSDSEDEKPRPAKRAKPETDEAHEPPWSAGGRTLSEVAGACPDVVRSLESGRMGSERGYFVLRLLTQPRSCGVRGELHHAPKAGALRFCSVAHSAFPVREL